jgi:hypothetical protein
MKGVQTTFNFLSEPNPYPVLATRQEKDVVASHLYTLLRWLRARGFVERAFVIGRAKVPIIKAYVRGPGNFQVDVSMGVLNGLTAVGYISRQVSETTQLFHLCFVQQIFPLHFVGHYPTHSQKPYILRSLVSPSQDQLVLPCVCCRPFL